MSLNPRIMAEQKILSGPIPTVGHRGFHLLVGVRLMALNHFLKNRSLIRRSRGSNLHYGKNRKKLMAKIEKILQFRQKFHGLKKVFQLDAEI